MTAVQDISVSESYVENDVGETTESAQTEVKYPGRIILGVLRRVFSIELVAFLYTFSYGLHIVIRLSVFLYPWPTLTYFSSLK